MVISVVLNYSCIVFFSGKIVPELESLTSSSLVELIAHISCLLTLIGIVRQTGLPSSVDGWYTQCKGNFFLFFSALSQLY